MIVAATGHRPDKLGGYSDAVQQALVSHAEDYLRRVRPEAVITGMAFGWDQAVAQACIALGIPYIAAVPFEGQEHRWPADSQERYQRLLGGAFQVEIVCEHPSIVAMQIRNEWMVDRADRMLALWNGTPGGTANCIRYARRAGKPIDNIWPTWSTDLSALLA